MTTATPRVPTVAYLLLVIAVVAVANVVRSAALDGKGGLPFNLALAAVVVLIGLASGLTGDDLGLARSHLGAGVRYGAVAFAVVAVVVVVAAFVPALSDFFDDSRVDVGLGAMLARVLLTIPVGTVVVEELIFRGVILAELRRLAPTVAAVAVASVLFGLWHVYPAARAATDNDGLEGFGRLGTVLGTFAATTLIGVVFCWLRLRSGSLVAPILAHIGTNSVPFAVAWVLAR